MHNIIFIEGLPGSGKTTFTNALKDYCDSKNIKVIKKNEGDLHPLDVSWCAILKEQDYKRIIKDYPSLKKSVEANAKRYKDYYIVAYTKLAITEANKKGIEELKKYELYTTKNLETFKSFHLDLYTHFSKTYQKDTLYLFECVFLQNHINELILKHNKTPKEITNYFNDLLTRIKNLNPVIFYIDQTNPTNTLNTIISERRSPNKELWPDWIDAVNNYLTSQPYAQELDLTDDQAVFNYAYYRKKIENAVLSNLLCDSYVVDLDDNYDEVLKQLIKNLSTLNK
ncbi:MAG: hypothetical protein K9L74_03625 [Candidatus Izimaplasma sp.]|nr:hypothetical protein [Candidatus Izimaplasma bacterium]